ncbi:MAG: carboxypeptidase regulatory-like domain-containing protein [Bryobacteraceae bacterium]
MLATGGPERGSVLRMELLGASSKPDVRSVNPQSSPVYYFRGGWTRSVPTFSSVRYNSVYPGVDLLYYGHGQQLEYDFVVAPNADPGQIRLGFKGTESVRLAANGDLILQLDGGEVKLHKPVAYQEVAGRRVPVEAAFLLRQTPRPEASFAVGSYDASLPLVLDPVLSYATFLGGTGADSGAGIALDASGNAYVTGTTTSNDFPVSEGAVQSARKDNSDVFVSKLNPTGTAVLYSVYLGGSGSDRATGIAVDAGGSAYISGFTDSIDFPVAGNAVQSTYGGGFRDAFAVRLNPTGTALTYSTYIGGSGEDNANGIAVDGLETAFLVGATDSSNFPTTRNAFQTGKRGVYVPFVSRLGSDGSSFVYSTYLGGSGVGTGWAIAVDAGGGAYVTGQTDSADFPTTQGAFRSGKAGGNDVFATKLDPGGALVYSTFVGGAGEDAGLGVAADNTGSAYITGETRSGDFPVTPGALQVRGSANRTAFLAKLLPAGNALSYATFLGGSGGEYGASVAVDSAGSPVVTGQTSSTDFPVTRGAIRPARGDGGSAFASKLSASGNRLIYSTFLGAGGGTRGAGVALDASGNAYVTGAINTGELTAGPGVVQPAFRGGDSDAFVARIADLFSISGRVLDAGGQPIGGATITLDGVRRSTAETDSVGVYTFTDLPASNYAVSASKTAFRFSPATHSFNDLSANQTADFTGTFVTFAISGRIADDRSRAMEGVTVTLTGGRTATAQTDAKGEYSFPELPAGSGYIITPSRQGFSFTPRSEAISSLDGNHKADFKGVENLNIGGKVSIGGIGVADVAVVLSGSNAATVRTNNNGDYLFPDLPPGGSYAVSASKAGFVLTPARQSFENLAAKQTAHFSAAVAVAATDYVIASRRSRKIQRVAANGRTITDIATLPSETSCPTALAADPGGYIYVADPCLVAIHKVAPNGTVVSLRTGEPMKSPVAVAVDIAGNVYAGDNGTNSVFQIRPSGAAITEFAKFALASPPNKQNVAMVFDPGGDLILANDDDTKASIVRIRPDGKQSTIYSGPAIQNASAMTLDGSGNFLIASVKERAVLRVTPAGVVSQLASGEALCCELSGITLDPVTQEALVSANTDNKIVRIRSNGSTFVAYRGPDLQFPYGILSPPGNTATPGIGGRVTDLSGNGLADVTVTLSGTREATVKTDSSGLYQFRNLAPGGNYTLAPSRANYAFVPKSQSFSNLITLERLDFSGAQAYSITGFVLDGSGSSIADAAITLTGALPLATRTDVRGAYAFRDLPVGAYAVSTSKGGFIFTPFSHSIPNLNADVSVNFTGGPPASPGDYIVIDNGGKLIYRMTTDGRRISPLAALTGCPSDMAADLFGNVYAIDPCQKSILKINANGGISSLHTGEPLKSPYAIAVDITGAIFVADNETDSVFIFSSDGRNPTEYAKFTLNAEVAFKSVALELDARGDLILAHDDGQKTDIIRIKPDRTVSTVYSGAAIARAGAIELDGAGNVIVGDSGRVGAAENSLIRVSPDGSISQIATSSQLCCRIAGLVFEEASGDILATVDVGGAVVRVTPSGAISTVATVPFRAPGAIEPFSPTVTALGIGGRIADPSGAPVPDVEVRLTGSSEETVKSDSYGVYAFRNLTAGASYTVTPSKTDFGFSPPSYSFPNLAVSRTAHFLANLGFTITGRVAQTANAGLAGVTVTLSGAVTATTQTDVNGVYTFRNVPVNGSYAVRPSREGFFFLPSRRQFSTLGSHQTGDFTAGVPPTSGDYIIADSRSGFIYRTSPAGQNTSPIAELPGSCPTGLAGDGQGSIFVADACKAAIWKVSGNGVATAVLTGDPLKAPVAVVLDANGDLIVGDVTLNSLLRINPITLATSVLAALPEFPGIKNMALTLHSGEVVVASDDDAGNARVARVKADGTVTSVLSAGLEGARAILVDPAGDYIVGDPRQDGVIRLTATGRISTIASACCKLSGLILEPDTGNILATLDRDARLVRITPSGVVSTLLQGPPPLSPAGIIRYPK